MRTLTQTNKHSMGENETKLGLCVVCARTFNHDVWRTNVRFLEKGHSMLVENINIVFGNSPSLTASQHERSILPVTALTSDSERYVLQL